MQTLLLGALITRSGFLLLYIIVTREPDPRSRATKDGGTPVLTGVKSVMPPALIDFFV